MDRKSFALQLLASKSLPDRFWPLLWQVIKRNEGEVIAMILMVIVVVIFILAKGASVELGVLLGLIAGRAVSSYHSLRRYSVESKWYNDFVDWEKVERAAKDQA